VTIATSRPDASPDFPDAAELLIEEARRKGRRRRLRKGLLVLLALVVVLALVIFAVGTAHFGASKPTNSNAAPPIGANLTSVVVPHFDGPVAMAVSGGNVWVVNEVGNSITEFNATTGSQVRIINAQADAFHHPDGIAVQGSRVWVSNSNEQLGMGGGNYDTAKYSSVTELNARNGSLVRVIKAPADQLLEPGPIAVSGSHVWVLNQNASSFSPSTPGNSLIELNASTGSLVHVFKTNVDGLNGVLNLTATTKDVWLTSSNGSEGSVTELNSRTGSLVRVIEAKGNDLIAPDPISVNGSHVWIGNIREGSNKLTELNARTGSLIRVIKAKDDEFNGLLGVVAQNSHVWVTNGEGYESGGETNSVTELNGRTGSLEMIIKVKDHGLYGPTEIVASGSNLWVLNVDSVSELNQRNGSLIQVVK
jgi:hypothetical protein